MPEKLTKSNTSTLEFLQGMSLTPIASYYINHNNITSISNLKVFLRDKRNISKLPEEVVNEYLALIEIKDPLFVASFMNPDTVPASMQLPKQEKTPLSVLCLKKNILDNLGVIRVDSIEDVVENFFSVVKVLTYEELQEVESKIVQWNEFLVKEALLLSIPTDHPSEIEVIDLKLISGVLSRFKITTVGDLVQNYPSLYNGESFRNLANLGKLFIVDQFYQWYSKTHLVNLHQEFSDRLIDISPFRNYNPTKEREQVKELEIDKLIVEKKKAELNQISDDNGVSIDELNLSTRSCNILKRNGIQTISLLSSIFQRIDEIPGIGSSSISEIQMALERYNPLKILLPLDNVDSVAKNNIQEDNNLQTEVDAEDMNSSIRILGLSTRAYQQLARAGITTLNQLIKIQFELTMVKGIGPTTESEILNKLTDYLNQQSTSSIPYEKGVDLQTLMSSSVNELGFHNKSITKLHRKGLFSFGAAIKFLDEHPLSTPAIRKLTGEVTQVLEDNGYTLQQACQLVTSQSSNTQITTEIPLSASIDQWFSDIDERGLFVIEQYYGLRSGEKKTLEEVSKKLECTRERVRQIRTRVMDSLQGIYNIRKSSGIDYLWSILNYLESKGGISSTSQVVNYFKGELLEIGLISSNWFFFLQDLLKKVNLESLVYLKQLDAWLSDSENKAHTLLVANNIEQVLKEKKQLLWEDLYANLISQDGLLTLDSGFALGVANCLKDREIINYSSNGLWSLPGKKDRKYYYVSALKTIGHPAHFSEIAKIASKLAHNKYSDRSANAVLNDKKDVFSRVGRGTFGLVEWGLHNDGSPANAARRILFEAGRPLPLELLIREILTEWQVEEVSITSAIDHDRRFERLPDGLIGLTEFGLLDKKYQRRRDQTKKTRIYLVLKELGKPTYYKDIADLHNEKYPDQALTESKVYQSLLHGKDLFVRTGDAVYSLVEWGIPKASSVSRKLTRKEQLLNAFTMVNHPMDYSEMTSTVDRLYPDWPMNRSSLSQVLSNNPEVFLRIQPGVYSLKEWHQS